VGEKRCTKKRAGPAFCDHIKPAKYEKKLGAGMGGGKLHKSLNGLNVAKMEATSSEEKENRT